MTKTFALFAAAAAFAALISGYPTDAHSRVVECRGGGYAISYPCVVRGRVVRTEREYYAVSRTTSVSVRESSRFEKKNPCTEGHQWYPSKGECIETHALVDVVEKAPCTPGQTRRIDDPSNPKGFRILPCDYIRRPAGK